MITGFVIGMVRLLTNIFTNTGKDVMTGWYWKSTSWFWQTNWLIFYLLFLVFIILLIVVVSFFTPKPTAQQIEAISFTSDYKKQIGKSWSYWDIVASLGVVAFCILFYIYFW
jgi:SSS family solute:Na+ symporter